MIRLLSLLLATCLKAQEVSQPIVLQDFSGGLNTYQMPLLIKDNESQSLNNVVIDKAGGSVDKRQGYTKLNTTKVGDGATDVNAIYNFEQSNGNKYCVTFSSTNGYYSTDGCQTFTSFVSTLTRNNDVNCDSMQDRLYCGNNQYNFYFNGTANAALLNAPASIQYLRVHHNRCFAVTSATPYRLYYSVLGDCTIWNTSTDYIDISPNDGDVITGIGYTFFDMMPIYKKYSTWVLKGFDRNSFNLINISRSIGAKNHRSIKNLFNEQLFDSVGPNGGQPGIYAFNGIVVSEASKNLRNSLDLIDTFKSAVNRKTIDTQTDWSNATFSSMSLSASRQSGFMQSSYTSVTDGGTLWSSYTSTNVLILSADLQLIQKATNTFINAGSESNSTTINWSKDSNWNSVLPPNGNMYGSRVWQSGTADNSCSASVRFSLLDTSSNTLGTPVDYQIGAYNQAPAEVSVLFGTFVNSQVKLRVTYRPDGTLACASCISDMISQPFIPPSINGTTQFLFKYGGSGTAGNCQAVWDVNETTQTLNGVIESNPIDMGINTPIWSPIVINMSSSTDGSVKVYTKSSNSSSTGSPNGYDSYVQQTNGAQIATTGNRRFIVYKLEFNVGASTSPVPIVNSVFIAAASTGVWTSNEVFLSNNMGSTWGLFQTNQTVAGSQASITYSIQTSTYSGGESLNPEVTLTPGNAITASTGAYVVIHATYTVGVGSEVAKTDSMILNWNEGTQATSASAEVFKNRYHYGAQSLNGSQNDTIYVMDQNHAWVKWDDVGPRSLAVVNQNLMMGGSTTTSGGFIYQLYNSDSDNGNPINSYYQTKDVNMGDVVHIKSVDRYFAVNTANSTNLTVDILGNAGMNDTQYVINLATGAPYGIQSSYIQPPINGNVFSLKFSNNAASQPWELNAAGLYFRDLGFQP